MNLNAGLMRMIIRITKRDYQELPLILSVNPMFRIVCALICILLCSLSRNAVFTVTVIAGELCVLAFLQPLQIVNVLRTVLPAVLFSFLITLPAVFFQSPSTAGTITMKVMESVMILAVLNETSSWKEMTGALQNIHVPSIVILTMDMTINFLVILSRFSDCMLEAVQMRSVGDTSWKDSQIGGILGTTFLKSQRMADRASDAMLCRGFEGEYQLYEKHIFHWQDAVYLLIAACLVFYYFYTESL